MIGTPTPTGPRHPPLLQSQAMTDSALATLAPRRSRPETVVRRVLRIPDAAPTRSRTDAAHRIFSTSMVISAVRCLLSYIVFPVIAPVLGAATGIEPYVGIPIGIIALVFDVRGIRRFWIASHKYRWQVSAVYLAVMVLVMILVVRDIVHLAH